MLSTSTEEYDRGLKWAGYQRIGSLTGYPKHAWPEDPAALIADDG